MPAQAPRGLQNYHVARQESSAGWAPPARDPQAGEGDTPRPRQLPPFPVRSERLPEAHLWLWGGPWSQRSGWGGTATRRSKRGSPNPTPPPCRVWQQLAGRGGGCHLPEGQDGCQALPPPPLKLLVFCFHSRPGAGGGKVSFSNALVNRLGQSSGAERHLKLGSTDRGLACPDHRQKGRAELTRVEAGEAARREDSLSRRAWLEATKCIKAAQQRYHLADRAATSRRLSC